MLLSVDETVPVPVPLFVTVRLFCGAGENVAVTALAAVPTRTEQVEVPVQSPVHPAKTEPAAGVAVKTMVEPVLMVAEHTPGQFTPPTLLVTDPVPVPATVAVTGNADGMNVALTDWAEVIGTVQVPLEFVQAPLHPANTEPAAALGVSTTDVPLLKFAVQVAPQLIPTGAEVTVPEPAPLNETESAYCGGGTAAKFATIEIAGDEVTVVWHVDVPLQEPPQVTNVYPGSGVAIKFTTVPAGNDVVHVPVQVVLAGELLIEPPPVDRPLITGTVRETFASGTNVAVTEVFAASVIVQGAVPTQEAPVQPENADPAAGTGVRVIVEPESNGAVQLVPQLMPAGALVTDPVPLPASVIAKLNCGVGGGPKFATTA